MGWNPINLAFRFLLELAGLFALGYWGWNSSSGIWRIVLGFGVPLLAAGMWATFRVPGEPFHPQKAPVPVPGILRLLLEIVFFGFAAGLLIESGVSSLGWGFAAIVLIHYVASYDRVLWLLGRGKSSQQER